MPQTLPHNYQFDPDAVRTLLHIGHEPERIDAAICLMILLEGAGARFVMRPDYVVEVEAPGRLCALMHEDPDLDRAIKELWPDLANLTRARHSFERSRTHLRDRMITVDQLANHPGGRLHGVSS